MRLIDADAFIVNSVKDGMFVFQTENVTDNTIIVKTVYGDLIDAINNAPTIDAEPVRHGEWIAREIEKKGHFIMKIFVPVCSVCDAVPPNHIIPKYCPNCGAKMDGGKQDAD